MSDIDLEAFHNYFKTKEGFERDGIFPIGKANKSFVGHAFGQSYLKRLDNDDLDMYHLTLEPGTRTYWHIHRSTWGGGLVMICVAGSGWHQVWGEDPVELKPGDIVSVKSDTKVWTGAKRLSWVSFLLIDLPGAGRGVEWCEPSENNLYD